MGIFKEIPQAQWPSFPPGLCRVFKSDEFLVQEYKSESGQLRLSVNAIKRTVKGWKDGITWEQLQHIKRMIGYANRCAIEVFPPDKDLVNVANMRHLWIVDMPDFAWKNKEGK